METVLCKTYRLFIRHTKLKLNELNVCTSVVLRSEIFFLLFKRLIFSFVFFFSLNSASKNYLLRSLVKYS